MTVAELIAKLQECDPNSAVCVDGDSGIGLLGKAQILPGWFCPGLVKDGTDDFWSDSAHCSSFPDGLYHPRPEDQRAIYLRVAD